MQEDVGWRLRQARGRERSENSEVKLERGGDGQEKKVEAAH